MDSFYDKYEFFNITILDSPIDNTKIEIEELVSNWWGNKNIYENFVDLAKVNPSPLIKPGGAHFIKLMLWEPISNPNYTALFVNYQDAYDSLIYKWNKMFKKQSITLRLSNDSVCTYPHHEFHLRTKDNVERIVYSHVETKWEFHESGPIQDFENIMYYKRRKIRDRLNNDIINEYMNKLGFMIWANDFYMSNKKGIYFEQLSFKQ
jgi:hypothetical protein